jgi:hypothetical protein
MGKSLGLIGSNPYKKSKLNYDIGGAATKVLIDQSVKDEARGDAMDKYFKDWEKQINPAGLGDKELMVFKDKLNAAQEYGIKNNSYIRQPSKDGYEAYSTLNSMYKDLQSYIDGAKQKTATVKSFKDDIDKLRANGKKISANVLDVINDADKPYGFGYVAPSFANIKVYDQYDPKKFFDNASHKVQLEEKEESQPIIDKGRNTGFDQKTTKIVAPIQALQKIGNNGYDQYASDYGVQDHFDELYKDKNLVDKLNPLFGEIYAHQDLNTGQMITPKIQSGADLSRAVAAANQERESVKKTENIMNDEGRFKEWYRKYKIESANSQAGTNAILKAIALQGSQKVFDNALSNYTTNEVVGPNKNLNKLNLPVTYTNAYKTSKEIPKTIADEALMNQNLPYETKKIELTPVFGRDPNTGVIILAYPKVKSNGAIIPNEYEWDKAQNITNDLTNSLVEKAVGSQRTVDIKTGATKTPKHKM